MFQNSKLTVGFSFVRDRHASPEDANRLVMTATDSPKKRKRPLSPLPISKLPLHSAEDREIDMASHNKVKKKQSVGSTFRAALGDGERVNQYEGKRERLVKSELQNAWDRETRSKTCPQEERAANIIHAIREWERNVIFGNLPLEILPGPDDRDMGGQYLTNKEYIDTKSKLFEIAKLLPKGALLHLHFNAELHPELLLVQARDTKNMYIRSIRPIRCKEDLDFTEMVFMVLDPKTVDSKIDIFSDTYPKDAGNFKDEAVKDRIWMLWSEFQKKFEETFPNEFIQQEPETFREGIPPPHCGAPPDTHLRPAENWLRSKMVLSETEAYAPSQTVNGYVLRIPMSMFTNTNIASGRASIKRPGRLKAC